jgi:transcription antitermination factor NusG
MDKNKTFNDFLVLNQSLITNMESQSPEIKSAFDLVLEQIKAKFEIVEPIYEFKIGDKVKIPLTKSAGDSIYGSEIIKKAKEKGQDFLYITNIYEATLLKPKVYVLDSSLSDTGDYYLEQDLITYEEPNQSSTTQVKLFSWIDKNEIPQEIVDRILEYQLAQTGKKDINVFVNQIFANKELGGFNYNETIEGYDFWHEIIINGKFDKFYEKYPKTQTTKFKVGDKVKIPTTNAFGIDLALSPQIEKARNENQDYLYVRRIDFEGDYVLTAQPYGINGELFKEEDLVAYAEPTQSIAPKSNNPYDLVDKYLKYNGTTYLIKKLIKINPKNIQYEFEVVGNGIVEKYNVPKTTVQKWLQGEYYSKGKIIDLNAPTTAPTPAPPTPEPTPTPTATKEWTPQDLIGKFLKYRASDRTFYVEKLIRNNPKNKLYVIVNLDTNKSIEYSYEMREISKWLNGEEFRGVKIVEDPNLTTAQNPTQASVTAPTVFTKPFEFQIGDKVALPKTYNGKELIPSELIKLSPSYKEAIYEDQNYLYVKGINYRDGKVSLVKSVSGSNADLFDFVDIKPYQEPTRATAPIIVQTKVEGDYSTYSQFDLKEEKNEIEATLPYLDEDDEEYTELKLKLDMVNLWLD